MAGEGKGRWRRAKGGGRMSPRFSSNSALLRLCHLRRVTEAYAHVTDLICRRLERCGSEQTHDAGSGTNDAPMSGGQCSPDVRRLGHFGCSEFQSRAGGTDPIHGEISDVGHKSSRGLVDELSSASPPRHLNVLTLSAPLLGDTHAWISFGGLATP